MVPLVDLLIRVVLVVLLVVEEEQHLEDLEQQLNHYNRKVFLHQIIFSMELMVEILIIQHHILEQVVVVLVEQDLLHKVLQMVVLVDQEDNIHNLLIL
jgi:hypothetical protein